MTGADRHGPPTIQPGCRDSAVISTRNHGVSDVIRQIYGGFLLGFDRFLYKNILAGFSFGSRNYVTTHDVTPTLMTVTGKHYGSLVDAYYLDAILSFSYNRYDTSRHIEPADNRTAKQL